ncbi:hypothetical protein AURDEDRAFT_113725 [Auricularia subglabra TFB-10046 SS5]|nr:hypothetical protein AURDEDRAFT_113725 [Auricularia subglabra TFB-10046 SS5]
MPDYQQARRTLGEAGMQEEDAKANSIQVWYSSFANIDWSHDTSKDPARLPRLRRRCSSRRKARAWTDRTIGWFIGPLVSILTGLAAFSFVKSKQLFIDLKDLGQEG